MEGRVKEYLDYNDSYQEPYRNHDGSGHYIGAGDSSMNGKAYTYSSIKKDYNGSDIISYNGQDVYHINGYTMLIKHIREPWAMGEIIKNDLTLQPCYIGKINKHIAIGSSLRCVLNELREQIFKTYDNDDDIARAFVAAHPLYNKEYDWDEMVMWHSLDRTSCADGRRRFSANAKKGPGSCGTPKELIYFMKKGASRKIGEKMEKYYLEKENNE